MTSAARKICDENQKERTPITSKYGRRVTRLSGGDRTARPAVYPHLHFPASAGVTGQQDRRCGCASHREKRVGEAADSSVMNEMTAPREGTKKKEMVTGAAGAPDWQLLFSIAEVASILKVSSTTVRQLTHQGDLRCVRIGRRYLYRPVDIEAFVESLVEE